MNTEITRHASRALADAPEADDLNRLFESSKAPETRRVYATAVRQWTAFAKERGIAPLPARPIEVALWVAHMRRSGKSLSTARTMLSGLGKAHDLSGMDNPVKTLEVRTAVEGYARECGAEQKQAEGLTLGALTAFETHAPPLDTAIVRVMRDAMLRRSEAAALTWGDLEPMHDGSGRLTVRRSKTDQQGEGAVQYLSPATMRAVAVIAPLEPQPTDSLFGLSGQRISARIKRIAEAAGLGSEFSGHSCRVGMAQDLAASGVELPALMTAGRWKSPKTAAKYTRNESAGRGAVARFYGAAQPRQEGT